MINEIDIVINYISSKNKLTDAHIQEIKIGIEHGLPPAAILIYAKPEYDEEQLIYMRKRVESFFSSLHSMKLDK